MTGFNLKYWQLHNHELFTQFTEAEIEALTAITKFDRFLQHEVVYSHNTEIDRIYLLMQGRIKVACQSGEAVEVLLEILKEDDVFGELSLTSSTNSRCEFAEVLSPSALVCSFNLSDFENLLAQKPAASLIFSKMVARKLKVISGKYCDLAFKDVKTRVLNFFMLHAFYEGKRTGDNVEIEMYCTHRDIANFTASKRQTVTTIINNLVKENKIIYKSRSKVIIPDINKLTS